MNRQRGAELMGVRLPAPPEPVANYLPYRRVGSLLFLSGQGPRDPSGTLHTGKVGDDIDVATAYRHARFAGLNLLAVALDALDDLDRIDFVVKLFGMVNAAPGFHEHPRVINGCSDLFAELLGDAGRHARTSLGVASLPGNITVEIEAVLAIRA